MGRTRLLTCALVLVLLASACTRSSSDKETNAASEGPSTTAAKDGDRLAGGGFGDQAKVCQKGGAKGSTDTGVTDTEIHVATFTDKGFSGRPGLTKEMYDAAKAFTEWCNEHGGILGRKLLLDDRDARLTDYRPRILESCDADFAMVGGGAVFDDADNGERVRCGLPNIAGYVVSPKARVAGLQVQPVPNPVYEIPSGAYRAIADAFPDAVKHFAFLWGDLPSLRVVHGGKAEAVGQLGYKTVLDQTYNVLGESDWRPFVENLKKKGVRSFEMIGEPVNLVQLQKAMDTVGYTPDAVVQEVNFYDRSYVVEAGPVAKNTYTRTGFYPFELAADNPATQDYLDLMKKYNAGGRVAALGVQGISSWLLFAKAATECGSQLTRTCLIEKAKVSEWTGAGLHGKTSPAKNRPTPCFALLRAEPGKWVYDRKLTKPDTGIFNCDEANVARLKNDSGVPRTTP